MLIAAICIQPDAKANVYASNIKFNNSLSNFVASPGTSGAGITYILNEPATRGVVVNIVSGTNVVRSISIAAGNFGTHQGINRVIWDGKDGNGNALTPGIYRVSVTASATGFTSWTQTSTDTNAGYYVFAPRGIAVNTNPNSLYYGRVFVGNAQNNSSGNQPGDVDGILKVNADGSLADEGQSTGGYNWVDDGTQDSPHYLRYGQDDRIYALDFTGDGLIVACDMAMTTNEIVLNGLNYTNNPIQNNLNTGSVGWGIMDVTDAGTPNGRLWLGEYDFSGVGIWTWRMVNGVANTNDTVGTQAVAVGGDLDQAPTGGFMTDESSNIYVSQEITDSADSSARAMVFTNWNGVTAFTNGAFWKVGANDDTFNFVYDTALSSRTNPAYVAYALAGDSGGIRVLSARTGLVVSNAASAQVLTNLDTPNTYFGVAWDAVGNLYGASASLQAWRAFSPPGTNQATTISAEAIQILLPTFTSISVSGTNVVMTFTGYPNDAPSAYTIQSAANVQGPYTNVTSAVITKSSPGVFKATTSTSGATAFYRVKR
ncbi:MAG TPA: FlgD immunoglobulin-like domain containing protein [Verrucomicrobiae bacterium]|nr:FlgD immunoglobulin-like domain containing protein [Verrucomicrobiae bacterium]